MAKYRVNGKFATLKTFVKTYGLDSVVYEQLNKNERRVWNGLNAYENRVILDGKFAPKTLTENPTIKKFALDRNETLKQYIEENKEDILRFTNQGLINRSVNTNNLHEFINNHKGEVLFKGKLISKEDFLLKMDVERTKAMKTGNTVEIIYNFEVKNNGRELNFTSSKKVTSPPKKKEKKQK
jgi:hypothetical protein